jgi:taurine--2-oxoglutarate transaminase
MPLGAVVVSQAIADYFETHMLWGGLTYSGHPVCCAAAVANLSIYEEEKVFDNVDRQGVYLAGRLENLKQRFACVGDVRYKGLFSVIELVRDKATKEPLAPFNGTSPEIGLLTAYLKSQHLYAFVRFNMLWVCPPLIISQDELQQGLDIIEQGLRIVDEALHPQPSEASVEEVNYVGR